MADDYTENSLVEQPAIALFGELGWETANCFYETFGPKGPLGRESSYDVGVEPRLRIALRRLNAETPDEAINFAVEELTKDRGLMSPAQANREVYKLLKEGIRVDLSSTLTPGPSPSGRGEDIVRVRVIDWSNPDNNDFFLASQFWISGEMYKRRADLVGFVNGIPLVFIELKAFHKNLEDAYQNNLRDYKTTVPQLFWYNALVILSNGSDSRIGTMTAEWEHFAEWKKINSEGEEGVVSLETMIRGTCEKGRLLDLVENFSLFSEEKAGLIKMLAKNHQFLGVNNAINALMATLTRRPSPTFGPSPMTSSFPLPMGEGSKGEGASHGRLGVFWHTQGSGKSYSMVFFSQKVLRKQPGNFTFVVVTDRTDLDNQIYKNFARTGAVTEAEDRIRAGSGAHLKELLQEDHRFVFTLIQKFRLPKATPSPSLSGHPLPLGEGQGEGRYPMLSPRSDIIVITDEAHRTQYDVLALNMRNALPNAAFIGFTGTPLIVGEEKTREVFGDYVSIYNFSQSEKDKATVPLYYENRIPELQLTNENLNEEMEQLLEEAELDEAQEKKVEREFAREYHLITRDDRLEKIAEDLVAHFMGRGYMGKAMVVSIDKATAVRMYDKVKKYWKRHLDGSRKKLSSCTESEREELRTKIAYMEETDMAVVVSQSQNEVPDLKKKGVDIAPHRKRMVKEDLDEKFKDPKDPFRIVFVCAMWMTGFDVPSCSTIYLDKPMRNHTLMQTIARANRVFKNKVNGLIVDYVGVFRDLQKALAIYGSASGGIQEGDTPIKDKDALIRLLKETLAAATEFCAAHGIDLAQIQAAAGFARIKLLDDAGEAVLVNDDTKKKYLSHADNVDQIFKAILPDPKANQFAPTRAVLAVIAQKIRSLLPPVDISGVMKAVEGLLDRSIAAHGYVIKDPAEKFGGERWVDLSQIDFKALKAQFDKGRKRMEIEKLKAAIQAKLAQMVARNKSRVDYLEKFQRMIEEYNAGSYNTELFFKKLVDFAKELNEEEKRGIAERLNEEELAIFDLLTKPEISLTKKEKTKVKKVSKDLLETLKQEKLVLDWRKRQQARASVRLTIEETLDKLPSAYTPDVYRQKCDVVYQHVYDSYYGSERSVYESIAT